MCLVLCQNLFYSFFPEHAADTCTQDIREVSTPGGFSPSASDIHDQCQDTVKMREREEVEWAAEVGNDTAVAVSIDINEETGITDIVSDRSCGEGLSPDLCYNAEGQFNGICAGQSIPNNHLEPNEERNDFYPQDALTEKQRDEGKIRTDVEEDMRGNAEVDDQAEKRETLSQPEESVKYQDNDSGRLDGIRQRRPQEGLEGNVLHNTSYNDQKYKQEVSNMHVRRDYPQQVKQRVKEIIVMDENRDKDGNMEGYEQSERRGKASTKYLDRDAALQDNEGSEDVRQNMYEDLGGTKEVGQDYDHKPVSVDTQGGKEMMEIDVKVDKEGNTGADVRGMASGRPKLLTKYDLCYSDIQHSGRVGDSKQNMMPKYDQRCEQGGSHRYKRHEQQREEKVDVKGAKEQKRGDDKYAQRRAQHFGRDVEDQTNGRLDDVRENRSEQKTIVTRTRRKDVGVARQAKEQEKTGYNEHIQDGADSSLSRAGFAGSRRLTENQGVCSVEKTRQGEGRHGSRQSRTCYGKIIEEESKETHRGTQRGSETKYIRIGTVASQDGIKSRVEYDVGNYPKTDAKVSLSKGFCNLKLSESPLPQKHRTKGVIGNETNSTIHVNARKMQKVSEAQVQAAGIKHAMKKGGEKKRKLVHCSSPLKQDKKKKNKQKKTPECFSLFRKGWKNAERSSESD